MIFKSHYQNAYVTRDLDKAIAFMEQRYGVQSLFPIDLELDVIAPGGAEKLCMRMAFAWIGNLQLELIQPQSGCVQHYVDSLPESEADFSPRFNHVALRRDDLDAMRAEIDSLKLPILFEGRLDGLVYIYVDAREELGHILEYVWATPDAWDMIGWPK
jgi:hypothetical protein